MKFVIKCSYKANVGARAGSGAETFWKSEPEWKQKVSAPQHWCRLNLNEATPLLFSLVSHRLIPCTGSSEMNEPEK